MIAPLIVPVRDAVVALLNGAGLTPAITAIGIYDMTLFLDKLTADRVVVIPAAREADLVSRNTATRGDVSLDIGIQHKCGAAGPVPSECDPYTNLLEKYAGVFLGRQFPVTLADASVTNFACFKVEYPHVPYDEHIREFRVFTAVLRPTFTVIG